MTEILTESFCERCGTRYTFESAAPRRSRLGKVRTLSKGMKNFVLSDDASFSEAMAEARSEEEFTAVSHQLDAFHQTFNFCLTCRQYTCGDCWNTPEGRCLTCAPVPGIEEPALAAAYGAPAFEDTLPPPSEVNGIDPVEAWPDEDLSAARLSRALGLDEAETDASLEAAGDEAFDLATAGEDEEFDLGAATAAAAAVTGAAALVDRDEDRSTIAGDGTQPDTDVELEPVVADADPLSVEDAAASDDAAPAVLGVAPGQSLEDAVAAYEARIAAEEDAEAVDMAPSALIEPAVDAGFVEDALPMPAIADAEPEPEPVAEAEPETIASAIAAAAAVAAMSHAAEAAPDELPVAAEAADDADLGLAAALAGLAAGAAASDRGDPHVDHAAAASAAAAHEPEATRAVQAESEPEPEREPEPEPVAPVAAEPARVDIVTQPTWQPEPSPAIDEPGVPTTPDAPATPAPAPWLTVAPEDSESPQWPVAPSFPTPSVRRDMPTTLAGRPLVPQADPSGLWAASAREVLTGAAQAPVQAVAPTPTAQPCVSCGLSLSANARFCRRCGTRQG